MKGTELIDGRIDLATFDLRPDLLELANQCIALTLCQGACCHQRVDPSNEAIYRLRTKTYPERIVPARYRGGHCIVAMLITETVLLPVFNAYAEAPFEVMAPTFGDTPTGTVATTVLLAVPITTTV